MIGLHAYAMQVCTTVHSDACAIIGPVQAICAGLGVVGIIYGFAAEIRMRRDAKLHAQRPSARDYLGIGAPTEVL